MTIEEKKLQGLITPFTLPLKQKIPSKEKKKKVIVIAGPTGIGKTQLSLIIAQAIGGEIISADSMQIYRGMDIGTAKASIGDRRRISHHLIDYCDLDETFNVVEFCKQAQQAFKEIFAKGHVPIVAGGTGFYIHALIYGPPTGPPSVPEVRTQLENEMGDMGAQFLYQRLQNLDPEYAGTITPNDRHKIIRALEIISLTNTKVSDFAKSVPSENDTYDFRSWFLYLPKEMLYARIDERCDQMIAEGLIEEVRRLEKLGLRNNRSASQAIGYRQGLKFLDSPQSEQDWSEFVRSFKQASRRYAKRQCTWFKREPLFRWINMEKMTLELTAELILQDYESNF